MAVVSVSALNGTDVKGSNALEVSMSKFFLNSSLPVCATLINQLPKYSRLFITSFACSFSVVHVFALFPHQDDDKCDHPLFHNMNNKCFEVF